MGIRKKIERIMMAITFAEAGEHETARRFLREGKRPRMEKRVSKRTKPRMQLRGPSLN
jgi:hypothetical protein